MINKIDKIVLLAGRAAGWAVKPMASVSWFKLILYFSVYSFLTWFVTTNAFTTAYFTKPYIFSI